MFNVHTRKLYPDLVPEMERVEALTRNILHTVSASVDPKNQDGTVMPKIVWKYKSYMEISKQRILDFVLSVANEWNYGNVGATFVLLRCIYENEAYLYDIYLQLGNFIEKKDFNSCNELIMNRLFGIKMEKEGFPKISNVLTAVNKLNKLIPGFREIYDNLSELSHPNCLAMNLYAEFHETPYIHTHVDAALALTKRNFSTILNSITPSLMMIENLFKKIETLYPALTSLSDEDQKKSI